MRSCIKERGAVYVLWCKEDRRERERRVWHCVRSNTCAQQHCSCAMIVSPSRLWVRAQAGAWVLAVCEDECANGDAAADDDVNYSPCTRQRGVVLT